MLIKRLLLCLLLIICIFSLLAGCTVNINVGNPAEKPTIEADSKNIFDNLFGHENTLYESRAIIYIGVRNTTDTAISSSDLKETEALAEVYKDILQSEYVQDQIREEYPGVEYFLSVESINETELYAIIASGEDPEHLEEISNIAASVFCEKAQEIAIDSSCKVVDHASPAQPVGAN